MSADLDALLELLQGAGDARPDLRSVGYDSVVPAPQRWFDREHREFNPRFAEGYDYTPGGRYLRMPDRVDITGRQARAATVQVGRHAPRGAMWVSSEEGEPGDWRKHGPTVKTNLFKERAGWKWLERHPDVPEDLKTLVSVVQGPKHFYTTQLHFPHGVQLARYADSPDEPRLRPTGHGHLDFGPQVGALRTRQGHAHPVYAQISVRRRGYARGGLVTCSIHEAD